MRRFLWTLAVVLLLPGGASAAELDPDTHMLKSTDPGAVLIGFEDAAKAKVIAGRTWHLFDGEIDTSLSLGGYVAFQFGPSANTWLLQAPEFVPVALEKPVGPATPPAMRLGVERAMTPAEKQAVFRYASRPRVSVPAFHPILREVDDR
jgi:hypothetical protein